MPEHPEEEDLERRPGRSTGPTSPEGKEISSQNALKHGCCSNRLILADESEVEWRELFQGWLDDYQPGTQTGRSLVAKAAEAEWFLLRMIRRHKEAEQRLTAEQPDIFLWTDEQHKLLERFLRYRTTAERSFTRALNNLERLRKNRIQEADRLQKIEAAATAKAAKVKPESEPEPEKPQRVFCAQNSKKKQRKIHVLEQWVEVTQEDGRTVTTLLPSNEELMKIGKEMDPPPDYVYRRLHFLGSIPEEYHWTTSNPQFRESGGAGVQRMTPETWVELIEREKQRGDGQIGPCGGSLPRPKERGECECPVCVENTRILAQESECPD
jgi:hypothetical protein